MWENRKNKTTLKVVRVKVPLFFKAVFSHSLNTVFLFYSQTPGWIGLSYWDTFTGFSVLVSHNDIFRQLVS